MDAGRLGLKYRSPKRSAFRGHDGLNAILSDATIRSVLPAGIGVTIITDAGYKVPWFQAVQSMGWDFVGRVRGRVYICPAEGGEGITVQAIGQDATYQPESLGKITLSEMYHFPCYGVRYRGKQAPSRKHKARKKNQHTEKYKQRHREPWVIVTELSTVLWTLNYET